ncbi:LuxR C-terminal-related transcriptional regulator [Streptomyces sp. N35]|uniref:LuxR C-terminal-related transcriptional regulator n=1 Tax=Streptomyces sp. N35 TaxID=2795730 RepID=UPI0018F56B1A|nr:LuxR C-terminal-related transcriptional regulator [Streptomyces sp. N35]
MNTPSVPGQPLTTGQLDALRLLACGYSGKQIALRLGSTESGIHQRLYEATVRLGAQTRTHAVVIALRRGDIRFDDLTSHTWDTHA